MNNELVCFSLPHSCLPLPSSRITLKSGSLANMVAMKSRRLIALGEAWSLSKSLILGELSLFDLPGSSLEKAIHRACYYYYYYFFDLTQ